MAEGLWWSGGDGHGYRYQYIGPIHYLCECGAYFLNRERWIEHKLDKAEDKAVSLAQTMYYINEPWESLTEARQAHLIDQARDRLREG